MHQMTGPRNLVGHGIDADIVKFQRFAGCRRVGAQYGANSGYEFLRRIRFDHIIICPDINPLIRSRSSPRAVSMMMGISRPIWWRAASGKFDPRQFRHHPIKNDQIRAFVPRLTKVPLPRYLQPAPGNRRFPDCIAAFRPAVSHLQR